jgi:hypothetical protein
VPLFYTRIVVPLANLDVAIRFQAAGSNTPPTAPRHKAVRTARLSDAKTSGYVGTGRPYEGWFATWNFRTDFHRKVELTRTFVRRNTSVVYQP